MYAPRRWYEGAQSWLLSATRHRSHWLLWRNRSLPFPCVAALPARQYLRPSCSSCLRPSAAPPRPAPGPRRQGIAGSIPWSALVFLTLYLQLCGMSDAQASSLVALFLAGEPPGAGAVQYSTGGRERRMRGHAGWEALVVLHSATHADPTDSAGGIPGSGRAAAATASPTLASPGPLAAALQARRWAASSAALWATPPPTAGPTTVAWPSRKCVLAHSTVVPSSPLLYLLHIVSTSWPAACK